MARLLLVCALSLGTLLSAGCASSGNAAQGDSNAVVLGGRCRCEGGALCVQYVSQTGGSPGAMSCATARAGCASLSTATRTCWGSPKAVGLCLCSGQETQIAAAAAAH
jgi:hypothetical protein